MSEIGNTGDVSFKAIDALIERTRSLEVAGDEDSHKRVAATVARLRRSDELIEAQGNNLMQITPLLRGRAEKAIEFWRAQQDATGREAVLMPSGAESKFDDKRTLPSIASILNDRGYETAFFYSQRFELVGICCFHLIDLSEQVIYAVF